MGSNVGLGRRILDSLQNVVASLGTDKDKVRASTWYFDELDQNTLLNMYRGDWVARKIVAIPAEDATREWRTWIGDPKVTDAMETEETRLCVKQRVQAALIRARLFGGGAIVVGDGSSRPELPLEVEKIQMGGIKYLHVLNRHEINSGPLDKDPTKLTYGEPEYYELLTTTSGSVRIHPSRVIRFIGNELPSMNLAQDAWGDSVLQAVRDAVQNAGISQQTIAGMMLEAKVDVIKIPKFMEQVATKEYADALRDRWTLANVAKSTVNALLLDKEEEWERINQNFGGMPDLFKLYLLVACGAADIPATRFLGQSPAGMNATGESDLTNYYDSVKSDQTNDYQPRLAPLDRMLMRSALGEEPDELYYEWNALWQMSEQQKAEVDYKRGQTFQIDVNSGVFDTEALRVMRLAQAKESGLYPGIEEVEDDILSAPLPEETELAQTREQLAAAQAQLRANPQQRQLGGPPRQRALPPPARRDALSALLARRAKVLRDATPRTLYVRRDVLNAEEILAWARSQGLKSTLQARDLHVTIAFSRTPVDWMLAGMDWQQSEGGKLVHPPGGPRSVEQFNGGAVVLEFSNTDLQWRHRDIRERTGASWDFPEYRPHVTVAYVPDGVDLRDVTPYSGQIVFGPEIFEEVDEDWKKRVLQEESAA